MLGQIIQGLRELHRLNIIHRDLKSANIFLSLAGAVKLGDMNTSKVCKSGMLLTQLGTPYYASPEVWQERPYSHKSDMWSLGCVLFELCNHKLPFQSSTMEGLYRKVVKAKVPRLEAIYSLELNNVVRQLLRQDYIQRPSCDDLLAYYF